jgi:DNA-directed RNA polymerase specialized sigma24 family protein
MRRLSASNGLRVGGCGGSGSKATAQSDASEKARATVREHERRRAAARQAVSDAETELGGEPHNLRIVVLAAGELGVSARELESDLALSLQTVRKRLRRLQASGVLEVAGAGHRRRYVLTDFGREIYSTAGLNNRAGGEAPPNLQ